MTEIEYKTKVESLNEEIAAAEEDGLYKEEELKKRSGSLKCQQAARSAVKKLEALMLKRRDLERRYNLATEQQTEQRKKEDEEAQGISLGLREYLGVEKYEESVIRYGEPLEPTRNGWVLNDTWWGAMALQDRTILYSPANIEFYEYAPATGLWSPVTENKLTSELHTFLVQLDREIFKAAPIIKHVGEKFRHDTIRSQRGVLENKVAFLNKKRVHIQVSNGVIVFENNHAVLKDFSPDYYSLYASPLAYDPEAECPNFKANLNHLPEEDVELIQRAGGMFLLGRNDAEKIFLFEGKGNSRKSTLVAAFKLVLGDGMITELRTKHLDERFELYRVYDKSLLIGSDVSRDFMLQEGTAVLKKLTGHDPLTAEKKRSNHEFHFTGGLNVLVTSNSELLLKLSTDADAWMRRIVLIIFPSIPNPPAQKPNYYETLFKEEGEGILRWMVDGANKVLKDFAEGRGFSLTAAQVKRRDSRIEESDALNIFMEGHVEQTGDPQDGITTEDFLFEYGKFCRLKGWKHSRITFNQLKDAMLSFGGEYGNHVLKAGSAFKTRGYSGVRWKEFSNNGEDPSPKNEGDPSSKNNGNERKTALSQLVSGERQIS